MIHRAHFTHPRGECYRRRIGVASSDERKAVSEPSSGQHNADEWRTESSYRSLFGLSEGGMGRVELAVRREGKFERLYAVKRLQPAAREDRAARAMFLEEARLAGLIHGPHVVGVLDVGEDGEGPFLVMEYVDGVTVRDLVLHAKRSQIPLPVQLCCQLAVHAARGLQSAHELTSNDGVPLELVHRDVSPHNILVGFDGVARVVDFGIARALGRDHRTSTGILKGKLGYMAPEILRFEEADSRSDVFALGVVLFEMLAGAQLYGGPDDNQRARRILSEPPPEIGERRDDVPPRLEALLMRMLAKAREHRPGSARAIAEELEAIADELAIEEGRIDLVDYVASVFAEERSLRKARIREALAEVRTKPSAPPPVKAPATSKGVTRWRAFLLTAIVGVALGGGAVGLAIALASDESTTSSASPAEESDHERRLPAPSSSVEARADRATAVSASPIMDASHSEIRAAPPTRVELEEAESTRPRRRPSRSDGMRESTPAPRAVTPDPSPPSWGWDRSE
jgi:serine/threonine-protein kinase